MEIASNSSKTGCPGEIAYRMVFIDQSSLDSLAATFEKSVYGAYLLSIAADGR